MSRAKRIFAAVRILFLAGLGLLGVYFLVVLGIVIWTFEFKLQRWPTFVYGRPFCIRVGDDITAIRLPERLARLGYVSGSGAARHAGQWNQSDSSFTINLKQSPLREQGITSGPVALSLEWDRISSIHHTRSLQDLKEITLEPELLSVFPAPGQNAELCRPVPLEEIPSLLVDAIVLTEDPRFYSHFGIDMGSIYRALKTNIKKRSYAEGGSTLPQQLVRMTLLNPEKTLPRKINEISLALVSDAIYSKKTILQAYLNRVYLGHWGQYPIKGVAEAAFRLFGKDLSALDPSECALLAATIKAPNVINPFGNPERARDRRNMILGLLFKEGKISRDTYEDCLEIPLTMLRPGAPPVRSEAFLDIVRERLAKAPVKHTTHSDVMTSLEPLLQADSDAQLKRLGEAGLQTYLVICDPLTGSISAFLAPVPPKWTGTGGNHEILLPLMVIPALIPTKSNTSILTLTSRISNPGATADSITFRESFANQRGVLVKELLTSVGRDGILENLREFGVNARADKNGGILVSPMTPTEMTRIFSLLATLGNAAEIDPKIKISGALANPLPPDRLRVSVNPSAMFLVNHLMKGPIPAAGKQGADKYWSYPSIFLAKDTSGLWAVAYHQDALILARLPGDQYSEKKIRTMMTQLLAASDSASPEPHNTPDGIIFKKICLSSGLLGTSTCPEVILECFFKGTQPTEWCQLRHESKSPRVERMK